MSDFLAKPGSPGPIGALLDEYARAAEDFCGAVEGFDPRAFEEERTSEDPDCVSVQAICHHVRGAARGYANDLRKATSQEMVPAAAEVERPAAMRSFLIKQLRFTEESVEPLRGMSEEELHKLEFPVRWGPVFNAESLLEHAICHLLRHRRQLERW